MLISKDTKLTGREREVLILVARGFTNQEIASKVFISISTVKTSLHRACVKLGARNRSQAVILAMKRGAINAQDLYSFDELVDLMATLDQKAMMRLTQIVKHKIKHSHIMLGAD